MQPDTRGGSLRETPLFFARSHPRTVWSGDANSATPKDRANLGEFSSDSFFASRACAKRGGKKLERCAGTTIGHIRVKHHLTRGQRR